jgi:hypothetical protein
MGCDDIGHDLNYQGNQSTLVPRGLSDGPQRQDEMILGVPIQNLLQDFAGHFENQKRDAKLTPDLPC